MSQGVWADHDANSSHPGRPRIRRAFSATPTRPVRTVGLFGLFGAGNIGNDASLEAAIALLRRDRPDLEIVCICAAPDVVGRSFDVEAVPIRPTGDVGSQFWPLRIIRRAAGLVSALAQVRRIDAIVVPGTGILDDFGDRPRGMALSLLAWTIAARLAGVRVALMSVGAGPIRHPLTRRMMAAASRLASYRSYRDRNSKEFMVGIGVPAGGDSVYPDLVFSLPAPAPRTRVGSNRVVVGVGVMGYGGWYGFNAEGARIFERYLEKIVGFVQYLIDRGHAVRLLTGDDDDDEAVTRVLAAVGQSALDAGAVAKVPTGSFSELMLQVEETDIVVATRFHNVVCALMLGKPTVSIGYAAKNEAVMAEAGLAAYCRHIEHVEPSELAQLFETVLSRRDLLAAQVRCSMVVKQLRLKEQEERLIAWLGVGSRETSIDLACSEGDTARYEESARN